MTDEASSAIKNFAGCENCGCDSLNEFKVAEGNEFLFCPECLLYQKRVRPPYEHYEADYHDRYAKRREAKIITGMTRLAALTKYTDVREPRTLDVGCSIGASVEASQRMGWKATGVDVSQAAVDYCCEKGLDCYKIDDFELPFEDNTFDIVTSWHVIEHVDDVRATLNEWYRVVRPGGLLVLETPDSQCLKARRLGAKYQSFWPFDHLYTFTRSNMSSLLQQSGFEVLPSRVLGKFTALPLHLTLYAAGYRTVRETYRALGWCKSIEVCCRKPKASVKILATSSVKAA